MKTNKWWIRLRADAAGYIDQDKTDADDIDTDTGLQLVSVNPRPRRVDGRYMGSVDGRGIIHIRFDRWTPRAA